MTVSGPSRRRLSNGSARLHPSVNQPSDGPPIRLKFRLSSPDNQDGEDSSNENTQAPPCKPTSIRLHVSTPRSSASAGAPIIRPIARSREHVISESDISVLDLGPSLTQSHLHQPVPALSALHEERNARLNAVARASRAHRYGPTSYNRWPPQVLLSEANARQPARPRHAEASEFEPVSPDSNVSPQNDQSRLPLTLRRHQEELRLGLPPTQRFPLSMRRHQANPHVDVPSSPGPGLRTPPRRPGRPNLTGDIHCLGYGHGFGGFESYQDRSDFCISGDEMSFMLNRVLSTPARHASTSRRARPSLGTWDRRSSDLFTTGLSEIEQDEDLFPADGGEEMVN